MLDGVEFDLANNLAQNLIHQGRFKESLEILKELVKDLRFNSKVYFRMSVCYKELGDDALSTLNKKVSHELENTDQTKTIVG